MKTRIETLSMMGQSQMHCLDCLRFHGTWSINFTNWQWSTPGETLKIMQALTKRGLVAENNNHYKLTLEGRLVTDFLEARPKN